MLASDHSRENVEYRSISVRQLNVLIYNNWLQIPSTEEIPSFSAVIFCLHFLFIISFSLVLFIFCWFLHFLLLLLSHLCFFLHFHDSHVSRPIFTQLPVILERKQIKFNLFFVFASSVYMIFISLYDVSAATATVGECNF